MYCRNCGNNSNDNSIFCSRCGVRIAPTVSDFIEYNRRATKRWDGKRDVVLLFSIIMMGVLMFIPLLGSFIPEHSSDSFVTVAEVLLEDFEYAIENSLVRYYVLTFMMILGLLIFSICKVKSGSIVCSALGTTMFWAVLFYAVSEIGSKYIFDLEYTPFSIGYWLILSLFTASFILSVCWRRRDV